MLARQNTRVEIAQLQICVRRAQFGTKVVPGGVRVRAQLTYDPTRLTGYLRQLLRSEDDHRDEGNDHQLGEADAEEHEGRLERYGGERAAQSLLDGVRPSCRPARPRPRPDSVSAISV